MKKIVVVLCLLLPFVSCVRDGGTSGHGSTYDSLARASAMKDSVINDVFAALNQISENLGQVTSRENLLSTDIGTGEIRKQTTAQINDDIMAIDRLLVENRQTIDRLRRSADQLNQANVKIAGLEKYIEQLTSQMESKDQEIEVLRQSLLNLQFEVAELTADKTQLHSQVNVLTEQTETLQEEVKSTIDQLNIGYYIIGSEKELIAKEIVYKSGFIGRTLKINENRSLESFTQVDIRTFDEALVNHKKATVVSTHPADSYIFHADSQDNFLSLEITDKERFWEYSKVLVISYK